MVYYAAHFVFVAGSAEVSQRLIAGTRGNDRTVFRDNSVKWLFGILLLAVVARLGVVFALFGDYEPVGDASHFHIMAKNFLSGRGLIVDEARLAYRAPVPALYIAAIYAISGSLVRAVQIANAFLGVVTVWLAYDLVRRIFGVGPARWAGLFVALYPTFLLYTGQLLSETPVLLLIALTLWLAWWARNGKLIRFALLGVVIGLAALTRQTALPLGVFISFWILLDRRRDWLHRLYPPVVILACAVLTIAPWTLRNYVLLGKFVPLTSLGGVSLWIANNPAAEGTGRDYSAFPHVPELDALPETERGDAYQRLAVQFIRENPLRFTRLALRRPQWFWHLGYHGEGLAEVVFLVVYLPMLGLAAIGVWIGWRLNRDAVLLLLTVPVSLTAVHMVFLPVGRYRLPAELVLCMLAGLGAAWCVATVAGSRKRQAVLAPVGEDRSLR